MSMLVCILVYQSVTHSTLSGVMLAARVVYVCGMVYGDLVAWRLNVARMHTYMNMNQ